MTEAQSMTERGKAIVRAVGDGAMSLRRASCVLTSETAVASELGCEDDAGVKEWIYRPALRLYEHEHGDWTEEQVRATFAAWVRP